VERDDIVVDGSGYTVEGAGAFTSSLYGIYLDGRSNVTIKNTNVKNFDYGIWLNSSSNNSINGNNIANNWDGIFLRYSSNGNSIGGNTITSNSEGIWLAYSSNSNSINGNNITNNNYEGMLLDSSSNNSICHNNFVNNTRQVYYIVAPVANFWDNGCEGNYWSNYNGFDGNQDGVGEVQYLLSENDTDHYPLMNVYWNPCDINHDLEVNRTDINISASAFGTRAGDNLWNPHADITGPIIGSGPLVPDGRVNMRDISLIAKHYGEHFS
jgi:parallel beta-helix repeat protein